MSNAKNDVTSDTISYATTDAMSDEKSDAMSDATVFTRLHASVTDDLFPVPVGPTTTTSLMFDLDPML